MPWRPRGRYGTRGVDQRRTENRPLPRNGALDDATTQDGVKRKSFFDGPLSSRGVLEDASAREGSIIEGLDIDLSRAVASMRTPPLGRGQKEIPSLMDPSRVREESAEEGLIIAPSGVAESARTPPHETCMNTWREAIVFVNCSCGGVLEDAATPEGPDNDATARDGVQGRRFYN